MCGNHTFAFQDSEQAFLSIALNPIVSPIKENQHGGEKTRTLYIYQVKNYFSNTELFFFL